MTTPIERVKRNFDKRPVKKIEVEQWADEQGAPLTVYYNPLTVKAKDHLQRLHKKYGDTLEWLVHVLILHCRNAQGEHLFTLEDKPIFMGHADTAAVEQVAAAIMLDGGDIRAEKKN